MLTGPNGAGKTNLIEAISFLAPGRGLRRATLRGGRLRRRRRLLGGRRPRSRARSASPRSAPASSRRPARTRRRTRKCRIDREPVASAAAFADHLRVVWLVAGDGPAVHRARPRSAGASSTGWCSRSMPSTCSRVNALERALRSRNRLLEEPRPDPHWLDAIEHETAELAVAVAALRAETVRAPAGALAERRERRRRSRPPRSRSTAGWSSSCREHPAVEIEDRYRAVLHGQPRARRRRRPHARRPAPHRSRGDLCAEGHRRRRRLDRRAEGAADRARAGACRADRRDDRASRRCCCSTRWSRISIRRRAALYDALGRARRAGLDDRRRSRRLRRHRGRADMFEVSPGQIRTNDSEDRHARCLLREERTGPRSAARRRGRDRRARPRRSARAARDLRASIRPTSRAAPASAARSPSRASSRTATAPARSTASAKASPPSRIGERVWVWNGQWRRAFGTAAEYIVLPSEQAVRLPANISLEAGACLGIPAYTAYQAVEYAGIGDGSTVLVAAGAGGGRPLRHPVRQEEGRDRAHHGQLGRQGRARARRRAPTTSSTTSARMSASASWRSPASAASTR